MLKRDVLCQVCLSNGRTVAGTAVDHIIPKSEGGLDVFENLQAICTDCHKQKTALEAARARHRARQRESDV